MGTWAVLFLLCLGDPLQTARRFVIPGSVATRFAEDSRETNGVCIGLWSHFNQSAGPVSRGTMRALAQIDGAAMTRTEACNSELDGVVAGCEALANVPFTWSDDLVHVKRRSVYPPTG